LPVAGLLLAQLALSLHNKVAQACQSKDSLHQVITGKKLNRFNVNS